MKARLCKVRLQSGTVLFLIAAAGHLFEKVTGYCGIARELGGDDTELLLTGESALVRLLYGKELPEEWRGESVVRRSMDLYLPDIAAMRNNLNDFIEGRLN